MENFSTRQVALVPQAANVLTLAVVLAATWWSGAQRPVDLAAIAAAQAPVAAPLVQAVAMPALVSGQRPAVAPVGHAKPAEAWPVQATNLNRDGLQAVGYQPRTQR